MLGSVCLGGDVFCEWVIELLMVFVVVGLVFFFWFVWEEMVLLED